MFTEKLTFILQIASTLLMTGVIWLIQLVQYPFFALVGTENFSRYHASHTFWITPIVAPLMIIELITSFLIIFYPLPEFSHKLLYLGLVLTLLIWASTFFIQIPLHNKLTLGFNPEAHQLLVKTNWIRTLLWSLRALLILCLLWKFIGK